MDNKYGLGSTKVASEHHDLQHKTESTTQATCKFCHSSHLVFSPTMHDHRCEECGEWQQDIPLGYSTGRASDY